MKTQCENCGEAVDSKCLKPIETEDGTTIIMVCADCIDDLDKEADSILNSEDIEYG